MLFSTCATSFRNRANYYLKRPYSHLNYKEVIKEIKTPEQANHYLRKQLHYADTGTYSSFKRIHERGYGLCAEYAIAAAALLSDNDYPPLILVIYLRNASFNHAVYIFQDKKTGRWGCLGTGKKDTLDWGICDNIAEIVYYLDGCFSKKITAYRIFDLSNIKFVNGSTLFIFQRAHASKKIEVPDSPDSWRDYILNQRKISKNNVKN